MSKIKPLFIAAVAVVSFTMMVGDCFAQGCSSCAEAQSMGGFNYPASAQGCAGGCGRSGRGGGAFSNLKAQHAQQQVISKRVSARNEAWPMPFNCADRQLYLKLWEPMIDQGFEEQCVLNTAHFEKDSNELNMFGKTTVAGIMQNMPTNRRKVFISRTGDMSTDQARSAAVKNIITTFYGHSGPAIVEYSTKTPVTLRGTKAEAISRLAFENQPTPVIAIATGGSVNSAVGGN